MIVGRLDRKIDIEQPVATKNSIGEEIYSWSIWQRCWAQYVPKKADERYGSDAVRENRFVQFKTRYWPGLLVTFRILFEGNYYRIRGITEIGRREGWEVDAELLQGQANGG